MKHLCTKIILAMLMSMMGIQAFAHDIFVANANGVTIYYSWIKNRTELEVSYRGSKYDSYSNEYSGNVTIPESVEYEGKTYRVTRIGDSAFYGCSSLISVTIPNSVTSIVYGAFKGCSGLTSVTIPNSVTYIGAGAFHGCSGLTSVTIPNSVTSIEVGTFDGCSRLTSVTIPNSVTIIGESAFWRCRSLTSVTIPNTVRSIGYEAFYGCSGLTSVTIPNSVKSIGVAAFYGCSGLTSITIGNSVTSIGERAFYGCSSLTSVTIPNSVTSIKDDAFNGTGWYNSQLNGILYLDNWLIGYKGTKPTGKLSIIDGTRGIADQAFSDCSGLTSVTIPNSVTSIGERAFYGCSGLTSITIGNSVTSIGNSAFQGCIGLTSVTIPNSVTSIGSSAFLNCNGLEKVHLLREQPFALGSYAFSNISYSSATLYVPVGTKAKYQATDGWKNFKNIVEEDITSYKVTLAAKNYTREYGEENPTFGYEVTSGSIASGQPTFSCTATKTSPVGTYDIVIQKGTVSNGTVDLVKGTLTITKAPLTISAGNYSKKEGEDNPEFTLSYTGFKNGETKNVLTKLPTVNCSATKNSPAGNYTVSVSGAEAQNYEITYQNGTLTVTDTNSTSPSIVDLVNNGDMEGTDVSSFFYRFQGGDVIPAVITNGVGVNGSRGVKVAAAARKTDDYENQFFFRLNKPVYPGTKFRVSFDYRADKRAMVRSEAHSEPGDYINWTEFRDNDYFTQEWKNFFYEGTVSSFNSTDEKPLHSIAFSLSLMEEANNYYFDNIKFEVETDNTENPDDDNITFADANVKALCVANWDTNSDGELSKAEAAAVTDLGEVFQNSKIQSFNELQYFTGLKSIGESAFFGCTSLTSVIIPNSVTSFGENAFGQCWKLSSINFPESLTSIGKYAFWHCESLTSVTIPRYVTYIGITAFSGCIGLTSIDVDARNYYYDSRTDCNAIIDSYTSTLIAGCKNTVIPNTITTIAYYALHSYPSATITIPNSITTIEEGAFQNSSLTSITLPNSVTSIGQSAFANCESLKSVYIGNSVESIGIYAFRNCGSLEEVHISVELPFAINTNVFENEYNSVKEFTTATLYVPIGTKARYLSIEGWLNFAKIVEEESNNTPTVYNITFADANVKAICVQHWDTDGDGELSMEEAEAVTDIGTIFRGNTDIQSFFELQYFTGLKSIPSYAFEECTNLTTLVIPKAVTSIGDYAFYRCSKLADLITHDLIINIGEWAFAYNTSMTSFAMPNSASTIGSYAFAECEGLNMVVIMDLDYWFKVKFGSVSANPLFYAKRLYINGKELKELVFPDNITNIGDFLFTGSNLTSVTIPNSVKSIGSSVFYKCNNLKEVHSLIEQPFAIEPSVFQYKENNVTKFTTATLYVPAGTKAKYQATDGWNNFTNIVEEGGSVPADNITFADANVRALCVANWDENHDGYLSKTEAAAVTDLGEVFRGNRDIQSFDELQYFTRLTTIGEHAFHDCRGLTSITLPNSVTTIGFGAFWYCESLTSLVIPGSVETINQSAIFVCRSLTSITIPKSVTSIGIQNLNYCNNLTTVKVESGNTVYDSRNNCNAIIETKTNTLIAGCKGTTIPSTVTAIGRIAFQGSDLTTITIPNSVTSIGASCFLACKKLTTITIPSSVMTLGGTLFYGCEVLSIIKVESGNTVYDSRDNCNAIIETKTNTLVAGCKNTIIPSTVTSIGANAFRSCYGLTSITIPNSVKSIEEGAFQDCTGLKEVHSLIEKPFAIGMDVFQYDDNGETKFTSSILYVPAGTKSKYQTTDGWKNFTNIVESGGETPIVDNITFADANFKTICIANWDMNGDGELSKDEAAAVKNLGVMFQNHTDILSLDDLQNFTGLTTIGEEAFRGCRGLTSITIPNSVTTIGSGAFADCSGLTTVSIGNFVTTIENDAFLQTNILSLIWNSKTRLTQTMIDAFKENRSNMLIYVTDESVLPQTGMDNVVVSGTAQNIALKENSPFYSAQEFVAKNISFDHNFQMESGKGYAAGWESITLPFDVTKIVHESKGELVPFAKYSAGSNSKPFWLSELTGNGFKRAQGIEANKPYIVCMPNHSAYSSEYCLNGRVIFSGTNVVVKKTDETNMITVSYNGMTFRPTYQQQSKDNTVYPINAVSDYTTETGYQTAGSIFIRNLRDVRPFEAYFKTASASVRAFVALDFVDEAVTGLEEVLYGIKTNRTDGIRIYSISGQLVRASKAKTLSEATKGLPAGVYVVNGKKMIVTL